MIFLRTENEEDINEDPVESTEDDSESEINDDILDEVGTATEDPSDEMEGFGLIDENSAKDDNKEDEKDELEEELDEEESLEEDAEDVDFDTFDDIDEM